MNNQKIRLLRKEKLLEYLFPGVVSGFVIGIIFFLFSLLQKSLTEAIKTGLIIWITVIFFNTIFGFFIDEWYLRKRKLKKLLESEKYRKLINLGLKINDELEFVGNIEYFEVKFWLFEKYLKPNKYVDKHDVDIYCIPKSFTSFQDVIDKIKNIPGIKNAAWGYGILSIIYEENTNDFVNPLDLTIKYLKDSATPLSKSV